MPLSKRDREFRLPKISYLDFKFLEMDRVLTALFARLAHNGFPSRLRRRADLTVESFVAEFLEHPEWFEGFQDYRDVLTRWVETHLMDLVNRGKAIQAVAAPRPLHGFTYRFRNPAHSRDYGAAQHIYEMLCGARHGSGQKALEHLERFFFQGHDRVTGRVDGSAVLDVETQALLRLLNQVEDAPDTRATRESYPPLCVGSADLFADDIQRLLFYQQYIPRSVMVDYYTGAMRIDELLVALRERYGLCIDRLPRGDGFGDPTIADRKALRENHSAFVSRLRETGFYRDLSDAYVTQTITPRYCIAADPASADSERGKP